MIDGGRVDRAQRSEIFKSLKEKSICFLNTITYGPHTIAAMHAVFSGTYGIRTGTNSYWSTYRFKKNKFKTISEYLHENGYYTHADIVNELVIPKQGLDTFEIHDELKDDLTKRHLDLLEQMKEKQEKGKKFFLYLQYSKIHTGIMNEVLKVYTNYSNEYFQNIELNEKRYDNLFKNAEQYLQKMLEKISELGFYENSIILIMSDHGISVGEKLGERAYGSYCYDYTLRTFTYFFIPKFTPIEIKQQVRTIDFMPTILECLDIPHDTNYEPLDGESLVPLMKGKKIKEKVAFSETGNPLDQKTPPKEPNTKSVRISKWKLIINEYNNTKELYDLENDPKEENNLAGRGFEIEESLLQEFLKIQQKNNLNFKLRE